MKIFRKLIFVLASLAVFTSCVEEVEKSVATAIMTDKSSLEFGITDELTQTLTVYADAPWTVEYAQWLTIDPSTGSAGETVITVTADPNIREELPDRPRASVITFKGQNMYADAAVDALQAGDKYRDLVDGTLADAFAQEAETFVGVKDIQVVALASDGFVVKDEANVSYVAATQTVELGDKGSVYAYVSSFNGFPSLKNTDKFVKTSNETPDYSAAKDITSTLQAYAPEQIELVSITGKLSSKKIELYYAEGEQPAVKDSVVVELLNTHPSLKMNELDGWLVDATGYVFGKSGNTVYMVPVLLEGVKSLETVYFADDFEWIKWATVDAVGNDDMSTSVTNIWKADWADEFFAEFNRIGYQYLWSTVGDKEFKPGPEQASNPSVGKDGSMYACKNYLKFGQTSYSGALRLPALSSIQGTANVQIDFDWCWQVTGSRNPDIMTLSVETTNGKFEQTGIAMSEALESSQSQEKESSHLEWQHVTVILTEATAETVLTIRPTYADPDKQNPTRHQNRWYLDNIKIIEYTGSVSVAEPTEANISISMDSNITFDAAPEAPVSFTFLSDQEATLTAGADWIYFVGSDEAQLSELTIPAGTSAEVLVGCKEYTGSEARTTEITIESGLSVETIPVKQVSPGQKVESFVSIVGGNSGKVNFDEGSFNLSVQGNVEYDFESDAAWAIVEAVPETKALVEVKQFTVRYEANATPQERIARIRFFNKANNLETVYTLVQDAFVTGVFFQDDFTWVQPFVEADDPAKQGDSMLDNAQYTPGTSYNLEGFEAKLTELGYEALFPASKAIYVMKGNYLKFSKGKNINGIRLPKMNFNGESTIALSFDWGINEGANGPDPVELEVTIEGNGNINGEKKTSALIHTAGSWEWQTETIVISGVDDETRITIRPTTFTGEPDTIGKSYRWFLDNVKVEKYEGEVPGQVEPLNVSWLFSADAMNDATTGYAATFGTTAGVEDKTAGDGGQYVNANVSGNGKITYVQIDKTSLTYTSDKNGNPYKSTRITGGTGQPYVTGMWIGDYWLFEATDGTTYPAGTKVNVSYLTRTSATGIRYWRLEYLDGADWKPAMEVSTIEGTDLQYNVAMNPDGKTDTQINAVVTLTNPTENVKFRMVCVGGTLANGKAIPEGINGGTCRIAGAEGTSPVIKVITE